MAKPPVATGDASVIKNTVIMHTMPNCSVCERWAHNEVAAYKKSGWMVKEKLHTPAEPGKVYPYFTIYDTNGLIGTHQGYMSKADFRTIFKGE